MTLRPFPPRPAVSKKVHGVIVPNLVPLTADGDIHEPELRRMIEFLCRNGITGVYPNGSTGEFTRFTYDERMRITRIVAEQAAGRLIIIAGAAEANTKVILETCAFCRDLGCTAAVVCGPYYYRLSPESIYQHFAEIARETPIDLMLYNIPQFSNEIPFDVVKQLALEFPSIIGIKDSSGNLARLSHLMNEIWESRPDFCILTGTEEIFLPSLVAGVDGGTIATAGVLPEVVMQLYRDYRAGNLESARGVQVGLLRLIRSMHAISFPHGWRAAARFRGFEVGESRQHLSPAEKLDTQALEREICRLLSEHAPEVRCEGIPGAATSGVGGRGGAAASPDAQLVETIVQAVLRRMS